MRGPFEFDEIKKLRELVESTPPDPLKALEAEYEIALDRLVFYLSGLSSEEMNEHSTKLVQRLARHFLFNYYTGFAVAKFICPFAPIYSKQEPSTVRQRTIEAAIQKLARIKPARELMVEWFTAALEGKLAQLLREWLGSTRFTLRPKRMLYRAILRPGLSLAAEAEKWGRYGTNENVFKILDFALGGFYLIFKETETIRDLEFECLSSYLERLITERPSFFISIAINVIRVLAVPELPPNRREKISNLILSLRDLEKIPYEDIYAQIQDPIARTEARLDSMGLSRPISWILKQLLRRYPPKQYDLASEDGNWQKERNRIIRYRQVAEMIGMLASQDKGLLTTFENLITISWQRVSEEDLDVAFAEALPAFFAGAFSLGILARILRVRQQTTLPSLTIEALQTASISLNKDAARFLIETLREQGQTVQWIQQILENINTLGEPAERYAISVVQGEENPVILHALMSLHENLAQREQQSTQNLEDAIASRLIELMRTTDIPLNPQGIIWLLNLGREPLQRILINVIEDLAHETSATQTSRCTKILQQISSQVEQIKNPDAVVLAASWLVDPDDWIEDKRPLIERIKESIAMLGTSDTDRTMQNRIASILERAIPQPPTHLTSDQLDEIANKEGRGIANYVQNHSVLALIFAEPRHISLKGGKSKREGAGKRLVVAKALGKLHHSPWALHLLNQLFQIALEMAQVWINSERYYREFYYESEELLEEVTKSSASLKPLTSGAIQLLQKALITSETSNSELRSVLTPAFVFNEILPRLAHEVLPEAVPLLVELVWHYHCFLYPGDNHDVVFSIGKRFGWSPKWEICTTQPSIDRQLFLRSTFNEKIHRYLHIFHVEGFYADGLVLLCALQSLANVTNLTLAQQMIMWRVYRSSWHALTKSLCLLILGRQRPISEQTVRELIRVLRQDPLAALWKTTIKHGVRSLLFHLLYRMSPPEPNFNDFNYTCFCQTIAVGMIGNLLRQEQDDPIVSKHHDVLTKALLATTSLFRYGMEPHITRSESTVSGSKGLMRLLGATQEEEDRTTWIAHPTDRAYQVLLDLITAKAFSALQS